jgi:hypothetical protein
LREIDDQLKAMDLGQSKNKALYFPNEGDHVRVFEVPCHRRALVTKVNRRSLFLYYIDLGYEKVIIQGNIKVLILNLFHEGGQS